MDNSRLVPTDEYWIVWGVFRNKGIWANFKSREAAEERQRFLKVYEPQMTINVYHIKGEGYVA